MTHRYVVAAVARGGNRRGSNQTKAPVSPIGISIAIDRRRRDTYGNKYFIIIIFHGPSAAPHTWMTTNEQGKESLLYWIMLWPC